MPKLLMIAALAVLAFPIWLAQADYEAAVAEYNAGNLGLQAEVVPQQSVEDGINAVRQILSRCWFDETKCRDGLKALTHYRSEYDEKRRTPGLRPVHDFSSHGADAFRYLALALAAHERHALMAQTSFEVETQTNPWM